jgi:hypothetical protein
MIQLITEVYTTTMEDYDKKLGEFPCNLCIVQAACNNFKCSIIEEYLTIYHNNLGLFTADEIKTYRNSTDPELKVAMNWFISKKYDSYCYEYPIYINIKKRNYIIALIKDCDNRLSQKIRIIR